jgi:cytoplasmic iron level regulating protein YaaA (DUF328/UPF0246 family)
MKALILIPCSRSKKESIPVGPFSLPIEGLSDMRNELAAMVRETPQLINRPENKKTLVDGAGSITLAMDLYNGRLYQSRRTALTEVASGGRHLSVYILIVSAFYGLVRLDEGIKIYDLQMGDKLSNRQRVSEYWQANGLSSVLMQYVGRTGINIIWSLLPKTGYHSVFSDFWLTAGNKSIDCFRVDIQGVRQASGWFRGRWLNYMIRLNPLYLLRDPEPPLDIADISLRPFAYHRC